MTIRNAFTPPKAGDSVTFRKTMTVAEQAMFTGISGNLGGLYVDRTKAREQGLADMAVFELAVAALFTTGLSRLAGPGYRIAGLTTEFSHAIAIGATIDTVVTVTAVEPERIVFKLAASADGAPCIAGEAVMARLAKA